MNTIHQETIVRWLEYIATARAALSVAQSKMPASDYQLMFDGVVALHVLQSGLMRHCVGPVAVEEREAA